MNEGGTLSGHRLIYLFDLALEHRQGQRASSPGKSELGDYLASGEGSAFGPRLSGIVRWDLFQEEELLAKKGSLRGFIKTDDGFKIHFESVGFFVQTPEDPTKWASTAAVYFRADPGPYGWLNATPALWHGVHDMGSLEHSYRVFAQGQ